MKKMKIFAASVLGLVSVLSLASCGEKEISRDEAKSDLSSIVSTSVETPKKFSFSSDSTGSYVNPSFVDNGYDFGKISPLASSSGSYTFSYTYSEEDKYLDVKFGSFEACVYYKDDTLNFYSSLVGSIAVKVDFSAAIQTLTATVKAWGLDISNIINDYGTKLLEGFFAKLDTIEGVEESYKSSGNGNLSASVTYTSSNSNKYNTEFAINNYYLNKLTQKVNDKEVVNFELNLDKVEINIPSK